MAVPIVLSPDTAAATKANYASPQSAAQNEARAALAKARIENALPNGIEVTVPTTAIKTAT